LDSAELAKMLVKSEGRFQSKLLDKNLGRAVRETPLLVVKMPKNVPGFAQLGLLQEIQLGQLLAEEFFAKHQGPLGFLASSQKSQCFVQDKIGRDQRFLVLPQPISSSGMVGIPRHDACEPGPRIYENHRAPRSP
jgi:hypothetical protein